MVYFQLPEEQIMFIATLEDSFLIIQNIWGIEYH